MRGQRRARSSSLETASKLMGQAKDQLRPSSEAWAGLGHGRCPCHGRCPFLDMVSTLSWAALPQCSRACPYLHSCRQRMLLHRPRRSRSIWTSVQRRPSRNLKRLQLIRRLKETPRPRKLRKVPRRRVQQEHPQTGSLPRPRPPQHRRGPTPPPPRRSSLPPHSLVSPPPKGPRRPTRCNPSQCSHAPCPSQWHPDFLL